jgi:hypothetical protein
MAHCAPFYRSADRQTESARAAQAGADAAGLSGVGALERMAGVHGEMSDTSKPLGHLESLLEDIRFKKIEHYRHSQDHKLQGDVLALIEYDLIDVLAAERAKVEGNA